MVTMTCSVTTSLLAQPPVGWRTFTVNGQLHADGTAISNGDRLVDGIYDSNGELLGKFELFESGTEIGIQPKGELPVLTENRVSGLAIRSYRVRNGVQLARDSDLTFAPGALASYLDFDVLGANEQLDVVQDIGNSQTLCVYFGDPTRIDNDGFHGERGNNKAKRRFAITSNYLTTGYHFDLTEGANNRKGGPENIDNVNVFFPALQVNGSNLVVTEGGTTSAFQITLAASPSMYPGFVSRFNVPQLPSQGIVKVNIESSDTSEFMVLPATLEFNVNNWNTPQTVTVRGVDDQTIDGDISGKITYEVSGDSFHLYRGVGSELDVTNRDNDRIPPKVLTAYLNGDPLESQRSFVNELTVLFDSIVTVDSSDPDALSIVDSATGLMQTYQLSQLNTGGRTELSFAFGDSLPEGEFTLRIKGESVLAGVTALDGDSNGTPGGDFTYGGSGFSNQGFYRLFGDATGDLKVNFSDLLLFRNAFGKPENFDSRFDVNFDGILNFTDFLAFRMQLGKSFEP